jgi:hypothetical protein
VWKRWRGEEGGGRREEGGGRREKQTNIGSQTNRKIAREQES